MAKKLKKLLNQVVKQQPKREPTCILNFELPEWKHHAFKSATKKCGFSMKKVLEAAVDQVLDEAGVKKKSDAA